MAQAQQLTVRPKVVNLALYAGDDAFLDLHVLNADGSAGDLSGATVRAQIRSDASSSTVAATWVPTIDGNVIHLHLLSVDSRGLRPTSVFDVELTDSSGVVTTLANGSISMQAQVTR